MAITLFENVPVTMSEQRRTWCCSIMSPLGEQPRTEVYRERVRTLSNGETSNYQDSNPIVVKPSEMAALAQFAEVPTQWQDVIPDKAVLGKYLAMLPLLVAIACDAADRKSRENHT